MRFNGEQQRKKLPTVRCSFKLLLRIFAGVVIMIVFTVQWYSLNNLTSNAYNDSVALISNSHSTVSQRQNRNNIKKNDQNSVTTINDDDALPKWIKNYIQWHQDMRLKYPGSLLFTDPNAPSIIIRTCLGLCGGLNDRLGQLPLDIYIANQTQRILLLHWHRPVPLEHFLQPNVIDWSVPKDVPGFFPSTEREVRVSRNGMKVVRAYTELFGNLDGDETRPDETFWNIHFDIAMERAINGTYKDIKVLRHRILGHLHENILEEKLQILGETDMIHWTKTFGQLFWLFFKPSNNIQNELDIIYKQLNIYPGMYNAIHCRVRHPKAVPRTGSNINMQKGKNEDYPADKTGLPWYGETRIYAIQVATRALQCAQKYFIPQQQNQNNEPIYFFSDSNDLVRYMAHELNDDKFLTANATLFKDNTSIDALALETVKETKLIAREMIIENAHIDKQKGRNPDSYYGTFIDLLLAIHAHCIAFGIGNYALFATKISSTSCKVLYQSEFWGGSTSKQTHAQECILPTDDLEKSTTK